MRPPAAWHDRSARITAVGRTVAQGLGIALLVALSTWSCSGPKGQDDPPPACVPLCFGCGTSDGCGYTCGCDNGEECVGLTCQPRCPTGRCGTVCSPCSDGACPALDDRMHCGALGGGVNITVNGVPIVTAGDGACDTCGASEVCTNGGCAACPAGTNVCGNACAPPSNEQCGPDCRPCPADSQCVDNRCKCDDPAKIDCGQCVVPNTVDHCGPACTTCRRPGEACIDGACGCPPGTIPCGDACVAPNTNEHCGSCAQTCPSDATCDLDSATRCVCTKAGYSFCDGRCADIRTDNQNCGACGVECDSGTTCRRGRCVNGPAGCAGTCTADKPCCPKTGTCMRRADCDRAPD
jgi:hypothetical protein